MYILGALDLFLFLALLIPILYVGAFSIASSLRTRKTPVSGGMPFRKYLVLFPAYKEDAVIISSVQSFFKQNYPHEFYHLIVISDQMQPETNRYLSETGAEVLLADYDNSSKTKALRMAMLHTEAQAGTYDYVVIMDADNLTEPTFLQQINEAFAPGGRTKALQAHRIAKNINTDIALLDAVSEEINNSIFRKGHNRLGLSASLIGSGMVFDYEWFKKAIFTVGHVGFDKQLEFRLRSERIYIQYMEDIYVPDEKIQKMTHFNTQRRRWIATQAVNLLSGIKQFPGAVASRNLDVLNTVVQWMFPPRLILLGLTFLIACIWTCVQPALSYKWWGLCGTFILLLLNAIPRHLINRRLWKAVIHLPVLFFIMFINLFRVKGADKRFIHTEHTI